MSIKPKRKNPTPKQKRNLLSMNAGVCCVCKTRGQGVNFHHIDGDNTVLENLAVLCVKDHDAHHRPQVYTQMNHLELGIEKILKYKLEWEAFVKEAQKESPKVLAVINMYGTEESIHSMRLIFQTIESKIVFERLYHLHIGSPESWIDSAIEEVRWLGSNIPLSLINKALPIDNCPCCNVSFTNVIDSNVAKRITASDWEQKSFCSIYINPSQPTLAILLSYKNEILFTVSLHKCGKCLHFICDNFEERVPINKSSSVRTQATRILSKVLDEWHPAKILIGTGDEKDPEIIDNLNLPRIWEN
ncbi:MAG: HNH endonuclease signature motif containing protein [Thermoplasmata archaeon]|nr:HNH endonuclease signature motif containing protein [Thermoplasmata archaeon]